MTSLVAVDNISKQTEKGTAAANVLLLWLGLFTVGGAILTIIGELVKTRLLWYIRYADVIDLVLIAPLYLFSLLAFHEIMLRQHVPSRWRLLLLFLAFTFFYGHAMHLTANAIDTFSNEIRNYRNLLPDDTYQLIYFMDETLSHIAIFVSRYLILALLLLVDVRHIPGGSGKKLTGVALLVGVLFGFWEALVFIEGQKLALLPFIFLVLGGTWLALLLRSRMRMSDYFLTGPTTAFTAGLLPAIVVGLLVYLAVTGGFTEPSEMALWVGAVR